MTEITSFTFYLLDSMWLHDVKNKVPQLYRKLSH